MPTGLIPLPTQYIDAGPGPFQAVVRNSQALIDGVPVVFDKFTTEDVARQERLKTPSCFLSPPVPTFGTTANQFSVGRLRFNIKGFFYETELLVHNVLLSAAPTTGTRTDLVYLEFWWTLGPQNQRVPNYAVRVRDNVSVLTDEFGLETVPGQGPLPGQTGGGYVRAAASFADNEAALYASAYQTTTADDRLGEYRLATTSYHRVVYALPLFLVNRFNTTAYDPLTNPNGANAYPTAATRPDGEHHNRIGHAAPVFSTLWLEESKATLERAVRDYFVGNAPRNVLNTLDSMLLRTAWSDPAVGMTCVVPLNVLQWSHFQQDTDFNGLADGWTSHADVGVAGSYSLGVDGQRVSRAPVLSTDAFGITQVITGLMTRELRLMAQYKVINGSGAAKAKVILESYDATNTLIEASTHSTTLSAVMAQTINVVLTQSALAQNCTKVVVYVLVDDDQGTIDVAYVDVKTSAAPNVLMRTTNGLVFEIDEPTGFGSGLGFDTSTTAMANSAGTASLFGVPGHLRWTASSSLIDDRLIVGIQQAADNGFADAFVTTQKVFTATEEWPSIALGASSATVGNLSLQQSNTGRAIKTTYTITGTTNPVQVLPTTVGGRKVLMAISAEVDDVPDAILSQTLAGDVLTVTVTSTPVDKVDLVLLVEGRLAVHDSDTNGLVAGYRQRRLKQAMAITTNSLTFQLDGVALAKATPDAKSGVFINGVMHPGPITILGLNTPRVTLSFPVTLTAGDVVEFVVITREPAREQLFFAAAVADSFGVPTPVSPTMLGTPLMLVTTLGTGGTPASTPDLPGRIHNGELDGADIALTPTPDIEGNVLPLDIVRGRFKPQANEVVDTLSVTGAQGASLTTAEEHQVMWFGLVRGPRGVLLAVAEEFRIDERNRLDAPILRFVRLPQNPLPR